jgi:hypothetical protein
VRDELVQIQGDNMSVDTHQNFLRYVLWGDAISCLACGILQLTLAGVLSLHFGLSQTLLTATGLFLLCYGAVVAVLAMRTPIPSAVVWLLIVGNIGWGVLAVGVLLEGDARMTLLGKAYIVVQALTVLILAHLQYFCVRGISAEQLTSTRQEPQS